MDVTKPTVVVAGYALIAALFLFLGIQQSNQSYVIDEAEFPYVSRAVLNTGRPASYHGELRPVDVGAWHPPGYVYAVALWMVVFGDGHMAVRGFGLATALGTAALVVLILRTVRPRAPPIFGLVAFGLYLLHPFVLQSALLTDIDGTVGVLAVTAVLFALVRVAVAPARARWHVPVMAVLLALAFWTKLTTPLALIPLAALAMRPASPTWRRWALDTVIAVVGGFLLFVTTWWLLAHVVAVAFMQPFTFTLASFLKGGIAASLTPAALLARLFPTGAVLRWVDPVFASLAIAGFVIAFARWRSAEDRAVRLVALLGLGIALFYDVIAGAPFGFPKYWISAMPALTILAVVAVIDAVAAAQPIQLRWTGRALWPAVVCAIAVGVMLLAIAYVRYVLDAAAAFHREATTNPALVFVMVAVLLVIVVVAYRPIARPAVLAALLAVSVLGTISILNLAKDLAQRSAPYSVRYYPGEQGFDNAIADVRRITAPGEAVLGPKDIGQEADRPFYEDAFYFPGDEHLDELANILESGTIALVVTRCDYDYSEAIYPAAFNVIREHASPIVADIGSDFVLWVPNIVASGFQPLAADDLCRT